MPRPSPGCDLKTQMRQKDRKSLLLVWAAGFFPLAAGIVRWSAPFFLPFRRLSHDHPVPPLVLGNVERIVGTPQRLLDAALAFTVLRHAAADRDLRSPNRKRVEWLRNTMSR